MARKIHNVRVLVKANDLTLGEIQSETEPLGPLDPDELRALANKAVDQVLAALAVESDTDA